MPELLPCPLLLDRYNSTLTNDDHNGGGGADISDHDPDYHTLADGGKIMPDLHM